MNKELQQNIFNSFPELFKKKLPYGIECEDGWYDIIFSLCDVLNNHLPTPPTIIEIKQKFGSLRVYYSGVNDAADPVIKLAEKLSLKTCEKCGSSGKIIHNNYLYVACEKHIMKEDIEP